MLRLALMSACCTGAMSGAAMAQDAASEVDEVIVTAERATAGTKTDKALTEIPQSVSVITAEQFNDRAAVNFQDIFRYSAGVSTEQNGVDTRGDFFATRGFPVEQYLDGLNRMPSFVYGARLDIFTVERAEVLRGPSAVLYGGGGAGGLLNAISKRPQDEFGGEIAVVVGTDERKEVQFDVTGGLTDTLSARFVGVAREGHLQHESQDDNRLLANPSITWKPTDRTEITVIGLYQKDDLGSQTYLPISKTVGAVDASLEIPFDFFLGEPDFNHTDTEYLSGSVLLTHKFADNIVFNSRSRYFSQDLDYAEVYGLDFYVDGPAREMPARAWYKLVADYSGFNSDNNLLVKFDTGPLRHEVLGGVDYTEFEEDKVEGFDLAPSINLYNPVYGQPFPTSTPFARLTESSQLGFYIQDQIRAWDRVSLVLGARHDKVESDVGGVSLPENEQWSYRAGIIADLTDQISSYASYSESFLPVFGASFEGVPFVPRTGRQIEVGVKVKPVRNAWITAAYFDIEEDNYVVSDPDNIQNFLQTGKVGSKGVELEGAWRVPENFELTASYSYIEAEILSDTTGRTGARLENLPEHQASVWGVKSFDLTNDVSARVGMGVRYNGDKIDYWQNYFIDPTTLADAMVEFDYGPWNLSVNASNIFDTHVYTNCNYAPGAEDGYCYLGKGRTILASLRRRF